MAINEGLQKIDDTSGVPTDPNVRVPDHVRAAAAAAEAIHKQAYATEPVPPVTPPAEPGIVPPEPQPSAAEIAARAATPQPGPLEQPQHQQPAQSEFTDAAPPEALRDSEWARRYNSMKGRYDAVLRNQGAMEEQMRQMGVELVRTQEMLATVQQAPLVQPQTRRAGTGNENLITDQDRADYGDDLIDLTRRAAREAVGPELDALRLENERLTKQVSSGSRRDLFARMDQAVPTWRQINTSLQFKAWLRLPNVYTGQLRGNMLKAAVDGAEAPKVISLFKDFLAEAAATGQQVPQAQQIEQQAPAAVPHVAALALDTLAAPGRARPASGDTQVPADKPIYTRDQISRFYSDSRKGLYAGREAEYRAIEADLQKAQGEGRIR